MINLVALPCLCVDVFDGTDELYAGGEASFFAVAKISNTSSSDRG